MNKNYLLPLIFVFCSLGKVLKAQQTMFYYLVPTATTYTGVVGTTIVPTGGMNDGYANAIPIGFNFNFQGSQTPSTTVNVSTNGFATLNGALANSTPDNTASGGLTSGLPANRQIIAPLWDDLDLTGFGGTMRYSTTGAAPNRVFTVEWANAVWPYNVSASSASLSFQMKLYETTNFVDFVYQNIASSIGAQSASIGMTEVNTGPGSFISLNSITAAPLASYTTETNTISGTVTSGTIYHFEYCPPPYSLTHSNVTINSFVSNWTGPIANYRIGWDSVWAASPPPALVVPTTNIAQTFNNLTPNTTYYVWLQSDCGGGHLSPWVIDTITTLPLPPCITPLGLQVYGVTYFTANFLWTAVPGAVSYQFVLDQNAAAPVVQGTPTALTTHYATNLQPNTTYYFHLRTDCSTYPTDTSVWQTIQFTTLPLPPCQTPTGLYANNVTNISADLGWNMQTGILGWEFVLDQSTSTPISGSFSTTNAISATTLTSLTQYYLHVRTDCSTYPGDTSNWAIFSFITEPDSCTEPTGLQITFVNPYTAFVSWDAAPGAYAYEYIIDEDPNAPFTGGTPTFSTFHSVTGLSSSTQYYLHVRTVCDSAFYANSFTNWVSSPFFTGPGLKVNNVTGSNDFVVAAFPNPVLNNVNIALVGVQKGKGMLKLMDITGKIIKVVPTEGKEQVVIDMNDIATGVYMLRYSDSEQSYTVRLTKQ